MWLARVLIAIRRLPVARSSRATTMEADTCPRFTCRRFGKRRELRYRNAASLCAMRRAMNLEFDAPSPAPAAADRTSPGKRPAEACGIDFGTSNSAAAFADRGRAHVLTLQDGRESIPTAVFFSFEDDSVAYGREAMRRHLGHDPGRLMRSLKSILGTVPVRGKDPGPPAALPVRRHRRGIPALPAARLRARDGQSARRVVLGRPAFFVDDDAEADMRAQQQLESAAASAGFKEIAFQFEPIAAALHYESSVGREEIALVADIGGGTSDFSVVRVSPQRRARRRPQGGHPVVGRHPHRRHRFRSPAQPRRRSCPCSASAAG